MSEHTPGPWFYDKRTGSIGCAAGWVVGPNWHDKKGDGEFGDQDADGHLIAAAPDLLAACRALLASLEGAHKFLDLPVPQSAEVALRAIAKAKGKDDGE